MMLYFRDNLFNSGTTDILDERNEPVGEVDLRSAFGSSLAVSSRDGSSAYEGKFPFFSGKWIVTGRNGEECGVLRYRLSFLSKRFEYARYGAGTYELTSPAFSREYEIADERGRIVVTFDRVSGWFEASAYRLTVHDGGIDAYEWVAVVLGMHEIQKRHRQSHS